MRTAALLAQITNMAGKSMPRGRSVKAEDFLGRKAAQTAEEQIAFMRSLGGNK